MDFWRSFFRRSDHDIWTVIDRAITVAAADHPRELRARRDSFAEKLFAPGLASTAAAAATGAAATGVAAAAAAATTAAAAAAAATASRQADRSCRNGEVIKVRNINIRPEEDDYQDIAVDRRSGNRPCSFEALSDKIDGDNGAFNEFQRIKRQLVATDHQNEDQLLKLLTRLQALQPSYGVLKETEIGKQINALRKHPSSQVRSLAKSLVRSWAAIADEWVDSHNKSSAPQVECGLPTPPIDYAALEMSTDTLDLGSSLDLVDSMDTSFVSADAGRLDTAARRVQNSPALQGSSNASYSAGQPDKPLVQRLQARQHSSTAKATTGHRNSQAPRVSEALEAAKRKLQEGYQKIENAKRQRTLQVVELEDLPKGKGPRPAKRVGKSNTARR